MEKMLGIGLLVAVVLIAALRRPRPGIEPPSVRRALAAGAALLLLDWFEPYAKAAGVTATTLLLLAKAITFFAVFGSDLRPTITRLGLTDPEPAAPVAPIAPRTWPGWRTGAR